jgi:hypothetical protein
MPDYDQWARSIADPQGAAELFDAKLRTAVELFMARQISDDVFRGSLYALHFRGQMLANEFRYHDTNRHEKEMRT